MLQYLIKIHIVYMKTNAQRWMYVYPCTSVFKYADNVIPIAVEKRFDRSNSNLGKDSLCFTAFGKTIIHLFFLLALAK